MLPQPGLQAEEIDVEVPRQNTVRRFPAGVFVGGTMTRVEKTPTHQAHLEGRDNRVAIVAAPLQALTSLVPLKGLPPAPSKKDLCPGRDPTPNPASHLEKPVSSLMENSSPRFSFRERKDSIVQDSTLVFGVLAPHRDTIVAPLEVQAQNNLCKGCPLPPPSRCTETGLSPPR